MEVHEQRPILRSERVFLRPAERDDIPTFLEWLADADLAEGMASRAPWSDVAEQRWFDELQKTQGRTTWHFVICLRGGGRPIGFCALHDIDHTNGSAELGIGIGEKDEWGKGFGTETLRILIDFAFGELRLHRVFLQVLAHNERAIHVYEQVGFSLEGTRREAVYRHGRYHDMHVMGILSAEWQSHERPRTWELG